MVSFIPDTNTSSSDLAPAGTTVSLVNDLNSLSICDHDEKENIMSSSTANSSICRSLMESTTLGLQEIASSVISELQKDPKKKEVVVHVRVMRLCKDKKNKKNYTKAKITKLSYRLKVNQKLIHRALMMQKQQNRRTVGI